MSRVKNQLYRETHGDGPDVFMIHGWGMHSGVWRSFGKALSECGYRVTLVDLPGHGRSGMIDDYSLCGLGEALSTILPERVHLVGWSLGGAIALEMAVGLKGRVESLTMIASNARFVGGADWPGMAEPTLTQFAAEVVTDAHRALLRFFGLQTWGMENAKEQMRLLKACLDECDEPDADALAFGLQILLAADSRKVMSALQSPVLMLLGARDRLVPVQAGAAMLSLWQRGRTEILGRSAHLPFISEQSKCLSSMTRFWREQTLLG